MKSSCTYCSPLWSKAAIISSVLTVLSFSPRSASFHSHELHQIIWNITPAAAAQEVPDEAVRFPFEGGNHKGNSKRRKEFCIQLRVEFWIIINVIHLASRTNRRQRRFPSNTRAALHTRDKMCSHGNKPVMPLLVCQIKSTSAERNQLVTRLISHQYDGVTSESRAAFGLCERRLSLFHACT